MSCYACSGASAIPPSFVDGKGASPKRQRTGSGDVFVAVALEAPASSPASVVSPVPSSLKEITAEALFDVFLDLWGPQHPDTAAWKGVALGMAKLVRGSQLLSEDQLWACFVQAWQKTRVDTVEYAFLSVELPRRASREDAVKIYKKAYATYMTTDQRTSTGLSIFGKKPLMLAYEQALLKAVRH
jgi:hypothetical protein